MSLTARQRSIHNKNGTKRTSSFKGKRSRKNSEGEYLITNAPTDLKSIAYPGGAVALGLLLVYRITAALYGQIHDCDETYNYWEPLHYLVYGSGMQTWEYSPEYAIRSYFFLWLFAVPAKILSFFVQPITIFYTIRVVLAILTSCAELMFYKALCAELGVHVARLWLALALPAAGAGAAAGSLLPAAVSHALATAAAAAAARRRAPPAVALTAANALLSWPFTALLGAPLALDLLVLRPQRRAFLLWAAASGALLLLLPAVVDSWHYGRPVLAPWNILAYNVLSDRGPELYGVEPWTFYFVNGFLNYNVAWVLALACPALQLLAARLPGAPRPPRGAPPAWLLLAPLYLWLAVFLPQPHKEERFLYPVYSLVALGGAVGLDCVQRLAYWLGARLAGWRQHYLAHTAPLWAAAALLAHLAGVSRSLALHHHYHGAMTLLQHLPANVSSPTFVCYGKDWHRFPSSFHFPSPLYELRFIKSDFDGQLPAPYSKLPNATRLVAPHFNDRNEEDARTYLRPAQCHFLVELAPAPPPPPPPGWSRLAAADLLHAAAADPLPRAFLLPASRRQPRAELQLLRNQRPQ